MRLFLFLLILACSELKPYDYCNFGMIFPCGNYSVSDNVISFRLMNKYASSGSRDLVVKLGDPELRTKDGKVPGTACMTDLCPDEFRWEEDESLWFYVKYVGDLKGRRLEINLPITYHQVDSAITRTKTGRLELNVE